MMTNESGRSMVEMLGVLAIIGVLSIGGIAGYTQAMKKYRINEALNEISLCSVQCHVGGTCIDTTDVIGTSCYGTKTGQVTVTGTASVSLADLSGKIPSTIGSISGGIFTPAS